MKLKIELSEEQLQLLIDALEVNFRFMMRQGSVVSDLLAECPDKSKFDDERAWERAFDDYITRKDIAYKMLDCCAYTLYGNTNPKSTHRLSDMWSALRHAQYEMQEHKDDWDVRSGEPFKMSDWEMMKVEVEE